MWLKYNDFREEHKLISSSSFNIRSKIYLFKVTNRDTRKRCEICSKLTIKTPERRH